MPEPDSPSQAIDRQSIRREMRRRRRALTARQQEVAAENLMRLLRRQPLFQRSRHIAFYLPNDGEIDPRPLLRASLRLGKHCYLPALHPARSGHLWFLPYGPDTPLAPNVFGIPEPVVGGTRRRPASALDLVVLPLVAFDQSGARLGMGAGYYDRTFAFKAHSPRRSPLLMGLAHRCQEVEHLPTQPWDVPLAAIATDEGIIPAEGEIAGLTRDFLGRDLRASRGKP
jgi:5-formyltetrahydrofolate cyclo-ligase